MGQGNKGREIGGKQMALWLGRQAMTAVLGLRGCEIGRLREQ